MTYRFCGQCKLHAKEDRESGELRTVQVRNIRTKKFVQLGDWARGPGDLSSRKNESSCEGCHRVRYSAWMATLRSLTLGPGRVRHGKGTLPSQSVRAGAFGQGANPPEATQSDARGNPIKKKDYTKTRKIRASWNTNNT